MKLREVWASARLCYLLSLLALEHLNDRKSLTTKPIIQNQCIG